MSIFMRQQYFGGLKGRTRGNHARFVCLNYLGLRPRWRRKLANFGLWPLLNIYQCYIENQPRELHKISAFLKTFQTNPLDSCSIGLVKCLVPLISLLSNSNQTFRSNHVGRSLGWTRFSLVQLLSADNRYYIKYKVNK